MKIETSIIMENEDRDYAALTEIAKHCGMVPYKNRWGEIEKGTYTTEGFEAPVDLSACKEDEKSILKTAVKQLSERLNEAYHDSLREALWNNMLSRARSVGRGN